MSVNRPMSRMRKLESKEALFRNRKRTLKYLVLGYMRQEGYVQSAEAFASEADVSCEYELCDNIDLDIILQEYCNYYLVKFDKQPQFCRKVEVPRQPATRKAQRTAIQELSDVEAEVDQGLPASVTVTCLTKDVDASLESSLPAIERKPLSGFLNNISVELKPLAETVYQDIMRPPDVEWDDIKGLASAKALLMESVVYPVRFPEIFTDLEPWRGVLLHGPPGTGKTLLARAAAGAGGCTFFNVGCSTLVNKWRGDSEKVVKILFQLASFYSPSIIFIDEVETLASDRSAPGEHEASRRLKTQLLTELDGAAEREGIVFLLANSNMPWEIDPAMLRRLEKRIYISLPDHKTRSELFEKFLSAKNIELYPKVDFDQLATKTEGYSGSDIKLVCKEALMANVRKILPNIVGKGTQQRKWRIQLSDLLTAVEKTKPVGKHLAARHEEWQANVGCS